MKRKKTFSDVVRDSPRPKKLELDTRLPHVFDLLWDQKTLRDIYCCDGEISAKKKRMIAEAGYDVTRLPEKPRDELSSDDY